MTDPRTDPIAPTSDREQIQNVMADINALESEVVENEAVVDQVMRIRTSLMQRNEIGRVSELITHAQTLQPLLDEANSEKLRRLTDAMESWVEQKQGGEERELRLEPAEGLSPGNMAGKTDSLELGRPGGDVLEKKLDDE